MSDAHWASWHDAFKGLPPIGYILREAVVAPWVRLYALPDGERLPSTPQETAEMLLRENLVASDVLGDDVAVIAWVAHYGDAPPSVDMTLWTWAAEPPPWRGSADDLETLEGARFLERSFMWAPGALDQELQLRADDEIASLTVFAPTRGTAFCPYDGGIDVFLHSKDAAAALRSRFPQWLATGPGGL